jgi:NADPH:quinone reductase-like Zn-dependent oxidoreductase
MKAVRFHEHGGAEVLRYEDVPDPVRRPGDMLVRVKACALNFLDIWERRGLPRVTFPLPHISGSDIAGEVIDGDDVEPGTRVMIQPGLSCGRCTMCLAGRDHQCADYGVIGYFTDGGYAEQIAVPRQNIIPIPDRIGFVEAAAFPLTFLTAWHMLVARARIEPGEDVLVLAAGSGVGQAAIQVGVLLGARVIATAGSDRKLERARALGAWATINHGQQNMADEVRRLTGKRGVDVVIEHVGKDTWDASVRSLARGGRLVTCGATTGYDVGVDLRVLFAKQQSLLGSYMGSKAELLKVSQFFFEGRLAPVIDRTFPLTEAGEAQQWVEDRRQFGKVVLEVA